MVIGGTRFGCLIVEKNNVNTLLFKPIDRHHSVLGRSHCQEHMDERITLDLIQKSSRMQKQFPQLTMTNTVSTPPCLIVGATASSMAPSRRWTWKSADAGSTSPSNMVVGGDDIFVVCQG